MNSRSSVVNSVTSINKLGTTARRHCGRGEMNRGFDIKARHCCCHGRIRVRRIRTVIGCEHFPSRHWSNRKRGTIGRKNSVTTAEIRSQRWILVGQPVKKKNTTWLKQKKNVISWSLIKDMGSLLMVALLGFNQVLLDFTGFYWILLGIIGLQPDFTWFYWV